MTAEASSFARAHPDALFSLQYTITHVNLTKPARGWRNNLASLPPDFQTAITAARHKGDVLPR